MRLVVFVAAPSPPPPHIDTLLLLRRDTVVAPLDMAHRHMLTVHRRKIMVSRHPLMAHRYVMMAHRYIVMAFKHTFGPWMRRTGIPETLIPTVPANMCPSKTTGRIMWCCDS